MIRQNLLVIVFVLLSTTGCSMVPQSGCSCCSDPCASAKPFPVKHRSAKKSKCRCKHCAHHASPAPLFPGDPYGQFNAGYMPGQTVMMQSAFGSCGSECSECGVQGFDSGYSSGGMEMHGMPEMSGMMGSSPGGCNCGAGGGSMSGSMPGAEYPMMMPPSSYPPSHSTPNPVPHPQQLPQPHGKSAPLAPAESFEAPGTPENGMPPAPQDAGDMPPATPAVDPVSWQFPAQSRVSPQLPYPGRNIPSRRVEPIPTSYSR